MFEAQQELLPAGGRLVPPENLHLTLLFLGNVPTNGVAAMRKIATGIEGPVIPLELEAFGTFRQNRAQVLWLGPAEAPAELTSLHQSLCQQVKHAGLAIRAGAFRPHVTLMRKANPKTMLPERPRRSILWTVCHYALVASDLRPEGPRYTVLAERDLFGQG